MAIKIVTDSTAYVPADIVARYDIQVVPLKVVFEDRAYRDGVDLDAQQFYRRLLQSTSLPTTSQPSVGEFQDSYARLVAAGHEILSIHISSKLSGTYESASAAAALMPDARIHLVDSMTASLGLDMMVRWAAEATAHGRATSDILAGLQRMIREQRLLFVVDTLEYLEKGGRIGPARAMLGTLLKIKPILCLEDGIVKPFASVRTRQKALAYLLDHLATRAAGRPVIAAVAHGQAPDAMEELSALMQQRMNCVQILTSELSPVIGTHTGPGTLGAAICPVESNP